MDIKSMTDKDDDKIKNYEELLAKALHMLLQRAGCPYDKRTKKAAQKAGVALREYYDERREINESKKS